MDKILKVSNMTKDFGGLRAVDNVSFEVGKGEFAVSYTHLTLPTKA